MYKSPFQFQKKFIPSFFYLHLKLVLPLHGALYKIKILCARSLATNCTVQGFWRTIGKIFSFFLNKIFFSIWKQATSLAWLLHSVLLLKILYLQVSNVPAQMYNMLQHFIHFIIYMAPLHTTKTYQLCFVIFKIAINITFCKRGSFFPPHA